MPIGNAIDRHHSLRAFPVYEFLFSISIVLILFTPSVFAQDNVIELKNADVLEMVRQKLPTDTIVTKIQISRCHFDTFPTVISELKYRGVADEILIAMVEAPVGRPSKSLEEVRNERQPTGVVNSLPEEKEKVGPPPITTTSVTPSTKQVATTDSVPTSTKQNDSNRSVMLPVGERTSAKSLTTAKPEKSVTENIATRPTSNVVVSGSPEQHVSASPTSQPTDKPAQVLTTSQTLTNSDIIKLLHANLPATVIVAAIKHSDGNYDFSPNALLELKQAGADASIFLTMMELSKKTATGGEETTGPVTPQNKKHGKKND